MFNLKKLLFLILLSILMFSCELPTKVDTSEESEIDSEIPPIKSKEIHINSTLPDDQEGVRSAIGTQGQFVSVWKSHNQANNDGTSEIFSRLFNSSGVAITEEFQISDISASHLYYNRNNYDVDMASDGSFIVAWGTYSSPKNVYVQRYDSTGAKIGSLITVDDTSYIPTEPELAIAIAEDGDFTVAFTWESAGFSTGLKARSYNSNGTAKGLAFFITDTKRAHEPDISYYGNTFAAIWSFNDINTEVFCRLMQDDSSSVTTEFNVAASTDDAQEMGSVAMNVSGDFVVAWECEQSSSSNYPIKAQRFSNTGIKIGTEIEVTTHSSSTSIKPGVGIDSSGNFAVAWSSVVGPGAIDDSEIWMQQYHADGTISDNVFKVNDYTNFHQQDVSLDMNPNGDIMILWLDRKQEDEIDPDYDYGIFGKLFLTK